MSKQRAMIFLIVIIILGVCMRSYALTARSIWFDESFSWRLIQFPFSEVISRAAADVHPPLYYIILKAWSIVFGASILSLRAFSIALAAGSIWAIYLVVCELLHSPRLKLEKARGVGLTAALLLALSPWQATLAWEARMYTLGTFLALISTWLLVKAVRQKHQRVGWWIAYGICAALFIYTHYYAFFTLLAHAVWVVGLVIAQSRGRIGEMVFSRQVWYGAIGAILAILLFLPWLPSFLQQNSRVQQDFWIPPTTDWSIPETIYHIVAPTTTPLSRIWPGAALTLLPALVFAVGAPILLLTSLYQKRYSPQLYSGAWLVVACGAIPFLGSFILSLIGQSVYTDRFFAFSGVFLLAGVAIVVSTIPSRWIKATAISIAALGSFALYVRYWHEIGIRQHPGMHAAAAYADQNRTSGEPTYATSPFIFFPALYYMQEEFKDGSTLQLATEPKDIVHFNGGPIVKDGDTILPTDVPRTSASSLWLVETTGFYATQLKLPAPWHMVKEKSFPEIFQYQGDIIVRKYSR